MLCRIVLFTFQTFGDFPDILSYYNFSLIHMVREHTPRDFSPLKFTETCFIDPEMAKLVNVPCVLEKIVNSIVGYSAL